MAEHKNQLGQGTDEEKMNRRHIQNLNRYPDTMNSDGKDVQGIPHTAPAGSGKQADGPFGGPLMNFTQILEAMEAVTQGLEAMKNPPPSTGDIEDTPIDDAPADTSGATPDEKAILAELNQIFTPILVMQGFENDINSQKIEESYEQAGVLTERNIIQFDDATRMAQLISTCAILLQKAKNTEKYQTYEKAAQIRNQMKIDMQNEEYDAAKALAQKYLVMVSTTNNSPVARDAATSLLPQTQH